MEVAEVAYDDARRSYRATRAALERERSVLSQTETRGRSATEARLDNAEQEAGAELSDVEEQLLQTRRLYHALAQRDSREHSLALARASDEAFEAARAEQKAQRAGRGRSVLARIRGGE